MLKRLTAILLVLALLPALGIALAEEGTIYVLAKVSGTNKDMTAAELNLKSDYSLTLTSGGEILSGSWQASENGISAVIDGKDYAFEYDGDQNLVLNKNGATLLFAKDINAYRYNQGMEYIKNGDYDSAYTVFIGLAGYKDADEKAYALACKDVATLTKLSDTGAIIKYRHTTELYGDDKYLDLYGLIDFSTNKIVAPQWLETEKLVNDRLAVKINDKWGVIDSSGNYIFKPQWTAISEAYGSVCITYSGGLFGMVNLDGSVLQDCVWAAIGSSYFDEDEGYYITSPKFYSGLMRVQDTDGLWGYIDWLGTVKIKPKYISADEFSNGGASVITASAYSTIIDTNGEEAYFTNSTYFASQYKAKYGEAEKLLENGSYDKAAAAFTALGDYSDSAQRILESYYKKGESLLAAGDEDGAIKAFKTADDYSNASERINMIYYARGERLYNAGDYTAAQAAFTSAGTYSDSAQRAADCVYQSAAQLYATKDYMGAYELYLTIKGYKDVDTILEKDDNITAAAAALEAKWQVGKYVTFGAYEQDNNKNNGSEEIEWLVLERTGDTALVISRYALDCVPYNKTKTSITWEKCTLRSWLNNDFYNAAFTAQEKQYIVTSSVSADKNPDYSTNPGNATKDNVFLLSITEAKKYFTSNSARICYPTAYAKANGAYTNSSSGACWWWLRSPGGNADDASVVNSDGSVITSGYYVYSSYGSVRPCVRVRLF